MDINFLYSILVWFGGSTSIAVLVPLIVDILKRIPGLIKDGTSGQVAAWISLVGMICFAIYFYLSPLATFETVDATLAVVVQIIQVVLGLVIQLFVPPAVHYAGQVAELPILGYSLTVDD